MIKQNTVFTRGSIIQLSILYAIVIIFFYYISFNHSLEDLFTAISIATKIFLIPSIIGMFILKWFAELILYICK